MCSAGGVANPSLYISPATFQTVLSAAGVEISPVVAVTGGVLGAEVVKVVSGKDEPLLNLFVMDAMGGLGGSIVSLGV
jgi:hypothetical protein